MARVVDLELLHQVTLDAMHVYEAMQHGNALTGEGNKIVAMAEGLLREVTLAYIPEDAVITKNRLGKAKTAREAMISEYIEIQRAYSNLKDGLYQYAQTQVEAKRNDKALTSIEALLRIDDDYRYLEGFWKQIMLNIFEDCLSYRLEENNVKGDPLTDRTLGAKAVKNLEQLLRYIPSLLTEYQYSHAMDSARKLENGAATRKFDFFYHPQKLFELAGTYIHLEWEKRLQKKGQQ